MNETKEGQKYIEAVIGNIRYKRERERERERESEREREKERESKSYQKSMNE